MNDNPAKLHSYQEEAAKFIINNKKCALWLGMGAGKTLISLFALAKLPKKKILIISPLKVAENVWEQESVKHGFRFTFAICVGKNRDKNINLDADITIINKENIVWLCEKANVEKKWPYHTVVIDESSAFKSHSSKRFKLLKKMPYARMIQLTGTPSSNGYLDLWSQIFLLDNGKRLGKFITHYRNKYFNSDFMGYAFTLKQNAAEEIQEKIKDLVFNINYEQYVALPECTYSNQEIVFPEGLARKYKAFKNGYVLEENITAQNAAVLVNKLLQFCNGALYLDDSQDYEVIHDLKLNMLKDMLKHNDNNTLVSYYYKHDLHRLLEAFPNAVTATKENIEKWNNREIDIMLIHPASIGHGVNLQAGGHSLIWFSLPWSLELYQQTNARLFRQGQDNNVSIQHIVIKDTIDYKIIKALHIKGLSQSELLNSVLI